MEKYNFKSFVFGFASFLVTIVFSFGSEAQIESPARKIEDVSSIAQPTNVNRVIGARIVVADYTLLKRDFPHLKNKSTNAIDNWILSNVALMSESQIGQTEVNTEIVAEQVTRTAFRPPNYNRALVFNVDGGMIDGKGFGAPHPAQYDHGNGLATLGEMLREFLYQKLVQRIFDYSSSSNKTVGSYAVIDWGFRVKHADGTTSPAGAILRQAHRRANGTYSLLDDKTTLEVEMILRKFGITSAGAYRNDTIERLNIQGTSDGAILDFGGFLTVAKFAKPSRAFYGSRNLISPGSPEFLQPDPTVRVPLNMWGTTVSGNEDPKLDNPWLWSHELAEAFSSGRANRNDVENHVRNFLEPVENVFKAHGSKRCSAVFH